MEETKKLSCIDCNVKQCKAEYREQQTISGILRVT